MLRCVRVIHGVLVTGNADSACPQRTFHSLRSPGRPALAHAPQHATARTAGERQLCRPR